ncbi:DNA mismatch repair endonuclease MutL [Paenibacillus melissococcoides]|uniref:DNA mismatch repair protein MutL n=1 Tax=Paenibacillus melissococcoides TaxID=2912268 RepID=A0ABM9GAV6_9BACL|nr:MULTISPECIES: DNA mismatch repair endonuclease MutL [Paenibacillus]GIO76708.1 DNA mismatch repair protein MutL [Paenibacillus dendritiformis]CAH8249221.1 DNA mismatch repair endonuclease MutL [Paenibacillus melissococcoides]
MAVIHILDEHIANQIAAGEVVERPSSVVKELVENSIDAGSTRIDVTVEEGGLQLIRVKDNGSGIGEDDMENAFQRHATSKIASGKDLFAIRSLGFRGEALPSIAAVARVELTSSADDSGLGRKLAIEGGTVRTSEPAQSMQGTDIAVRDLFYNTPARLKYMKTVQTELGHISDYIYRLALAYPQIAFTLKHNDNLLLQTIGNGDLQQVIAAVYGVQTAKSMLPVEAEQLDYKLEGFIGKPELTRSNRNAMSWFVNGRYVRSFALNQAVLKAYHTLLPINRFPMIILHARMHPTLVDVNVHPAKLEVRFSKEPELCEFIASTLREILLQQALIPQAAPEKAKVRTYVEQTEWQWAAASLAGGRDEPRLKPMGALVPSAEPELPPLPSESEAPAPASGPDGDESARDGVKPADGAQGSSGAAAVPAENGQAAVQEADYGRRDAAQADRAPEPAAGPMREPEAVREFRGSYAGTNGSSRSGSAAPAQAPDRAPNRTPSGFRQAGVQAAWQAGAGKPAEAELPPFPAVELIGQLHGTYLIASNAEGLYLIDQHAAHERINYEYYYERFGHPEEASQELLLPLTLEFTTAEAARIRDRLHLLEQAGIRLEPFGGQTFLVRSYPHWFPNGEEADLVREMTDWVLREKVPDVGKLREASAIMCSCKASIKANQRLTEAEAEALLARLAACRQPYTCPHGRPIVVKFTTYDLEKMFKRVM